MREKKPRQVHPVWILGRGRVKVIEENSISINKEDADNYIKNAWDNCQRIMKYASSDTIKYEAKIGFQAIMQSLLCLGIISDTKHSYYLMKSNQLYADCI